MDRGVGRRVGESVFCGRASVIEEGATWTPVSDVVAVL